MAIRSLEQINALPTQIMRPPPTPGIENPHHISIIPSNIIIIIIVIIIITIFLINRIL